MNPGGEGSGAGVRRRLFKALAVIPALLPPARHAVARLDAFLAITGAEPYYTEFEILDTVVPSIKLVRHDLFFLWGFPFSSKCSVPSLSKCAAGEEVSF